jgi:hypothetical protein
MPTADDVREPAPQRDRPLSPESLARIYAVGVQCIATSLGFFMTAVVKLPVPLYFPLIRRWSAAPNSEELAMDFYGRSLVAIVVGVIAGALTLGVLKLRARYRGEKAPEAPAAGSGLTLLTGYAATAFILTGGVFAYQLYGRAPSPEPLPPGLSTLQTAQKPAALPPTTSRRLIPAAPPSDSDDSPDDPPDNPARDLPDAARNP